MKTKIKEKDFLVLDCTVRDGGYVNNWEFDLNTVKRMYMSSSSAGTDIFEVGFLGGDEDVALWRRCPAWAVKEVRGSGETKISGMLEANTVGMKLGDPSETGIDILRVALNRNRVLESLPKVQEYYLQGYQVFIQLMGITGYKDIDILRILEEIQKCESVEYVNIGDSYGSLLPAQTEHIIKLMKSNTSLKVGLHPHNNMQLGMANILVAIEAGADIVDGSMYGMGRGGGNVPLELILSYFGKLYPDRFNVLPVLEFIDQSMMRLTKLYDWGYSLPALLSGVYECHPYYTSKLVEKREYTIDQILKTVQIVNKSNVIGYTEELLRRIIENGFAEPDTEIGSDLDVFIKENVKTVSYCNRHKGRKFVILGNGPSLLDYQDKIKNYVNEHNAIVMGANNLDGLFEPTYHAFNNQRRYDQFGCNVSPASTLLLGPGIDLSNVNINYEKIICYNSSVTKLDIRDNVITSNCRSISILMAAVALVMGAESITFAGVDGYIEGARLFYDEEESIYSEDIMKKHLANQEYLQYLVCCAKKMGNISIDFLTPTTYDIK